jgi:TonB family protein
VTEGSTPVDTGARGAGFGLSSAGGVGGDLQLDVSDFCCPEYLNVIVASITRNWRQDQGRAGSCVVKFTIHRNGRIDSVTVDRPSGHYPLDAAAQRAVQLTQLPPLPAGFSNPTLTVHMTFRY